MEIFFYWKDVEARANKRKKGRDRGTLFWRGEKKKKIQRKLHKPRLKYPSIILI